MKKYVSAPPNLVEALAISPMFGSFDTPGCQPFEGAILNAIPNVQAEARWITDSVEKESGRLQEYQSIVLLRRKDSEKSILIGVNHTLPLDELAQFVGPAVETIMEDDIEL